MRYAIGVDGGGTKTTAAVIGEDLVQRGSATTGPANHRSIGMEAASANIAQACRAALEAAGLALAQLSVVCLCIAGFDTDLDLPVLQRAVRILGFDGATIFENDVVGAWAGATEAGPGVVVIAGTGATGLGMNRHGELWRTDGWDYILGDAGSGYAIGLAAIRAAICALDGRGAPTLLVRELGTVYGVSDAEGMRRLVDGTRFGKFEIAAFASHVADAARAGDANARTILSQAGQDLGASGRAIVQCLGMEGDGFPVCTVGSVFKSEPWVTDSFRAAIGAAAPGAFFRPPLRTPEVGGAILALRRVNTNDVGSWTLGSGQCPIRRSMRISEMSYE